MEPPGSPDELSRAFLLWVAFGTDAPEDRLAARFPERSAADRARWLAEFARVEVLMGQLAEAGAAGDFDRIAREARAAFAWADDAAVAKIGDRVGWIAWHEGYPFSRRG
jgi:hypothetical protein